MNCKTELAERLRILEVRIEELKGQVIELIKASPVKPKQDSTNSKQKA